MFISILATLFMTAFSYLCGYLTGHQFREPQLLNQLLNSSKLPIQPPKKSFLGWLLHLLIGYVFAETLFLSWEYINISTNWLIGLISGLVAGIIGIIGWHVMIYFNPNPPDIHLKKFYIQLVVAHIIFSLSLLGIQFLIFK